MDDEDALVALSRWLAEVAPNLRSHVIVRETTSAYGTRTVVEIDHLLVCPLELHDQWRVSTKPTFLPRAQFSSQARHYLKTASATRGRTIYCHEARVGDVVAALSYHLDDNARIPVFVTAFGLREDIGADPFLRFRTLAGALVLKHYAHAIAEKVGRGGHVDLDLANPDHESLMRTLGFQTAPQIKGLRLGRLHLRQPAPRA